MSKKGYVCIVTNRAQGTLYIGVTSNLPHRIYQHKNKLADGFTKKYNLHRLVYFETSEHMASAIAREKQLKNWHREWKVELIERFNSEWRDLYSEIL